MYQDVFISYNIREVSLFEILHRFPCFIKRDYSMKSSNSGCLHLNYFSGERCLISDQLIGFEICIQVLGTPVSQTFVNENKYQMGNLFEKI